MTNPGTVMRACEITRNEPNPSCECMTCQEYRESIRMRNPEMTLYCRAYTYWDQRTKTWVGDKEYTHAFTIEEARLIFWRSENEQAYRVLNIVGVAPVIGYFVTDKYGKELTV